MDLRNVRYCLGIELTQQEDGIKICQSGYIRDILDRFRMSDSKPVSTPLDPGTKLVKNEEEPNTEEKEFPYQELVGALTYLAVCTRPDIAYSVSYLSQFNLSCYSTSHWAATKRSAIPSGYQEREIEIPKNGKTIRGFCRRRLGELPE